MEATISPGPETQPHKPRGIGLLGKHKSALTLVYLMFALVLVQAAIKIPIAITHFAEQGDGSAFFEAVLLFVWLLSMIYYRKRRHQFS